MIKEKRRKKKRRMLALKIVLGVLVALVLAFLVVFYVFRVEDVEVKGNVLYDKPTIESVVLNDEYSWNSLYVFLKYKLVDTKDVPFIDTMEVSLKSPTTLQIQVYEKGMVGYLYLPSLGQNVYFDKDGIVVEISDRVIPEVPFISGITFQEVELYKKLPMESNELRSLLSLTQALKKYGILPTEISYGVENAPGLIYGGVTVLMGDLTLQTPKLERVVQILPSLAEQAGTLHMENWTEETTDIVFDRAQ